MAKANLNWVVGRPKQRISYPEEVECEVTSRQQLQLEDDPVLDYAPALSITLTRKSDNHVFEIDLAREEANRLLQDFLARSRRQVAIEKVCEYLADLTDSELLDVMEAILVLRRRKD